jgi:hypothetical protein
MGLAAKAKIFQRPRPFKGTIGYNMATIWLQQGHNMTTIGKIDSWRFGFLAKHFLPRF